MGHSPLDPAFQEGRPWNEGRLLGAKRALKQQQVWAIRDHKLAGADRIWARAAGCPESAHGRRSNAGSRSIAAANAELAS